MPEDTPVEPRPRSAREVIDAAIEENRAWERLGMILTAATGVAGFGLLVAGFVQGGWLLGGLGVAASSLLVPAGVAARRSRRENVRMRLLELQLQKTKSAAEMNRLIEAVFDDRPKKGATDATA